MNAVWDLWAKSVGKPVWKLVADLTPEQFVSLIDFRHIEDVLTPQEALEILRRQAPGKARASSGCVREGYPAYTTSVGWLGYDDDKMRRLCRESIAQGWHNFKNQSRPRSRAKTCGAAPSCARKSGPTGA